MQINFKERTFAFFIRICINLKFNSFIVNLKSDLHLLKFVYKFIQLYKSSYFINCQIENSDFNESEIFIPMYIYIDVPHAIISFLTRNLFHDLFLNFHSLNTISILEYFFTIR